MFAGFMINTWAVATIVAPVAGVTGFFVVLRGSAFPAHALPNSAFAGAAAANLLGISALIGLGAFAAAAAIAIATLGRRGRSDVATALARSSSGSRSARCSSAAQRNTSRSSSHSCSARHSASPLPSCSPSRCSRSPASPRSPCSTGRSCTPP